MDSSIEITTMCAIRIGDSVLMINRTKSWKGWAFPGGHLENGESVFECVKREMYEETGAVLKRIVFKGIANIYNNSTQKRHIIYNFVCDEFTGDIKTCCSEGDIKWFDLSAIDSIEMAEGMRYRLPLFFEPKQQELYIEWNEAQGYTSVKYYEI